MRIAPDGPLLQHGIVRRRHFPGNLGRATLRFHILIYKKPENPDRNKCRHTKESKEKNRSSDDHHKVNIPRLVTELLEIIDIHLRLIGMLTHVPAPPQAEPARDSAVKHVSSGCVQTT